MMNIDVAINTLVSVTNDWSETVDLDYLDEFAGTCNVQPDDIQTAINTALNLVALIRVSYPDIYAKEL